MADTNVGIQNLFVVNTSGIIEGSGIRIINFFDPTPGLPVNPANGDRYISLATANGWVLNNIEYFDEKLGIWKNIEPIPSALVYLTAINEARIFNPTAGWQTIAAFAGAVTGPAISTPDALVRWGDATGDSVTNSVVTLDNAGNMTGINDINISGKATIGGLIDPTGLQLTPQAVNPGNASTVWVNTTNDLRRGADPVLTSTGALTDNAIVRFDGTNGRVQNSAITIDDSGNITGVNTVNASSINISGKATIGGLLDPTGLQLTPQLTNPGNASTIWINTTNNLRRGSNAILTATGIPSGNSIVLYDGINGDTKNSVVMLSDSGVFSNVTELHASGQISCSLVNQSSTLINPIGVEKTSSQLLVDSVDTYIINWDTAIILPSPPTNNIFDLTTGIANIRISGIYLIQCSWRMISIINPPAATTVTIEIIDNISGTTNIVEGYGQVTWTGAYACQAIFRINGTVNDSTVRVRALQSQTPSANALLTHAFLWIYPLVVD
ncbi:MAG: hypothetical protein QW303_02045 [Nitrososphaerota archaeon]